MVGKGKLVGTEELILDIWKGPGCSGFIFSVPYNRAAQMSKMSSDLVRAAGKKGNFAQ